MTDKQRIGWLGTGRMGTAMASRLLNDGIDVDVWNRTAAKTGALVELGARCVDSVTDLAECDAVFTTVTSSADLLTVTTGEGGLLTADHSPSVIVDCSTVSAEAGEQLRAAARARGTAVVAAPIGGNPDMVTEGGAAIVASAPAESYREVERYLRAIAPTVVYAGTGEEARLVKLCHNLLLGVITEALGEATVLAEKGGVAPAAFLDFINSSVLASTFIHHKGDAIRARDYAPTFTTENLRKDFDLGLAAARGLEVPMPLAASTHQLIQSAIGLGHRDDDYVSLYDVAASIAGIRRD